MGPELVMRDGSSIRATFSQLSSGAGHHVSAVPVTCKADQLRRTGALATLQRGLDAQLEGTGGLGPVPGRTGGAGGRPPLAPAQAASVDGWAESQSQANPNAGTTLRSGKPREHHGERDTHKEGAGEGLTAPDRPGGPASHLASNSLATGHCRQPDSGSLQRGGSQHSGGHGGSNDSPWQPNTSVYTQGGAASGEGAREPYSGGVKWANCWADCAQTGPII